MRHSFTSLLFVASAYALPQSSGLEGLSQCAQGAALTAITATGCGLTDVPCICKYPDFQSVLAAGITTACGAADADAAQAWGMSYCAENGAPVAPSTTPISGIVGDPTMISASGDTTATATPTEPPASDATGGYTNATCTKYPHCHDGAAPSAPSNETTTTHSPTQPPETCDGKCPPAPSKTGESGPQFTGAASKLGVGAVIGAAVVAVAAFAL